jgi:hypothetical protein
LASRAFRTPGFSKQQKIAFGHFDVATSWISWEESGLSNYGPDVG